MKRSGLLMVIPTYNEASNVEALMGLVRDARSTSKFEVLFVDDNSPDGTASAIQRLPEYRGWVHLLCRERPMGLGSAYRAGFEWALRHSYDFVGEMDADLSHDPGDIPSLYQAAALGADLAIGSRYVSGGAIGGWPLKRRLLSRFGNRFARTLLRLKVRDVTAGFRVYSRRGVKSLLQASTRCDGYGFQIEGAYAMARAGHRIVEIPITFRDRRYGESKMTASIALEAAKRCVGLALRDRGTRRAEAQVRPAEPVG